MTKKIFLVDFDNTLIDTEGIREFLKNNTKDKVLFKKYLFKDSLRFIEMLKGLGKVIIFSLADDMNYQVNKIQKSGIWNLVGKKNVVIVKNKNPKKLALKAYAIIDDRAEILESAKISNPKIVAIWYRYGKYKDVLPKNNNSINLETNSFNKILQFLEGG